MGILSPKGRNRTNRKKQKNLLGLTLLVRWTRSGCLSHATILVLLATATWARVVASNFLAAIADRLDYFDLTVAAGSGLLSSLDCGTGGRFMDGGSDRPQRFLKCFGFLHAED